MMAIKWPITDSHQGMWMKQAVGITLKHASKNTMYLAVGDSGFMSWHKIITIKRRDSLDKVFLKMSNKFKNISETSETM